MNTERDPQIEALLSSQTPPEHRPGFWDDLRDDLDDRPGRSDAPVIRMDALRRRAPLLLVAAAALAVVAVVGFGYLGGDDDGEVDVATDPGPEGPETTDGMPLESGDLGPVSAGEQSERGSGRVVGVSADGQWLYVAAPAGDDQTGCEGMPREALYVEPVAGGERKLAAPADDFEATTVWDLHFDGQGRMAAVLQCEGFNARIAAGNVAADGTLADVEVLTLPEPECHEGTVEGITDIAYAQPGELIAATNSFGDGAETCQHIFSLPDTASEPTLISDTGALWVEATPDGRVVAATRDGEVSVDGNVIHNHGEEGPAAISLAPSGTSVAVSGGPEGMADVVLPLDGGEPAPFATDAYEVLMLDDVNGIMTADVDGERVVSTFRAGEPEAATVIVTGNISAFVVTPTADRIFVTVNEDTGENPRILEIPLTR